jgi:hypothetical protein
MIFFPHFIEYEITVQVMDLVLHNIVLVCLFCGVVGYLSFLTSLLEAMEGLH